MVSRLFHLSYDFLHSRHRTILDNELKETDEYLLAVGYGFAQFASGVYYSSAVVTLSCLKLVVQVTATGLLLWKHCSVELVQT